MRLPEITPLSAIYPASSFPEFRRVQGTNFPVAELLFDAAADEWAYWQLPALDYSSGNLTVTIEWYAVNATSGTVTWQVRLGAITPETDTQDVETKALATLNYVQDTHLGTTSKRLHRCTVTLSNLDSLANLDAIWLGISRDADGTNAADSMANDAAFVRAIVSYS